MQRGSFEQKRVKLADIVTPGGYDFTRRPNETQDAFCIRLLKVDAAMVIRCALAMHGGQEFPPVVITRRGDATALHDGQHRCTAAALLGREDIAAVIFHVSTDAEEELISTLAFQLSEGGVHWTKAVRLIRDALAAQCEVSA
jgi:hypothetical protein